MARPREARPPSRLRETATGWCPLVHIGLRSTAQITARLVSATGPDDVVAEHCPLC